MRLFLSCILFFLFPVNAFANLWLVDKNKSHIGFSGTYDKNYFSGKFDDYECEIWFDTNNLEKSYAKIKIDLRSVATKNSSHDKTLHQPDWFNTKNRSFALYTTTKISHIESNKYKIEGLLDIKGIVKKQDFIAKIITNEEGATLKTVGSLARRDFKIGESSDPSGDWVSLSVPLDIRISAHKSK